MPKTLKSFIFSINAILLSILLIVVFSFTAYLHMTLAKESAVKYSNAVSNQVFSSMYQIMRQGWSRKDLNEFMNSLQNNFDQSDYDINIYRGSLVEELFGKIKEKPKEKIIENVFQSGKEKLFQTPYNLRTIKPINAKAECLQCHTNAHIGDTLGVIEVRQNFISLIKDSFLKYILFSLILIPLFFLTVFVISKYITSKILASLKLFENKVENINSLKDFKEFAIEDIDLGFDELNLIISNVNTLTTKLKKVAVDKDILEFEVKLLDKMIITSEVVQDWRDYIHDLLIEINEVMTTYTLSTIFKVGDDQFEVDIFWYGKPTEDVQTKFEEYVRESISNNEYFAQNTNYIIKHNFTSHADSINMTAYQSFTHKTKSLFLEIPKIGGIVGLSVSSDITIDPVKHIVVDSILTTMANLVGSVKAITKYTQELEFYASHDPLTGLFNQRIFNDFLEYEIGRANRHGYKFSLMMIDCDNFKPINDNYGHAFGDKFLQEFADLLEKLKRSEDVLARYGGDEFVLILPECDLEGTLEVAKKISNAVENFKLLTPDKKNIGVTVSIGLSVYPEHSANKKELFMIADNMMYKVKESGKNGIKIPSQDEITSIVVEQKEKANFLIDAVTNKKIIPFFQPIQTVKNEKIEIHELLMRIEVDGKIIPAYQFIETAEAMGLINRMDLLVIENAFVKIVEDDYQGILFINLSPKSLIVGSYADSILKLITQYNIDKDKIVFEITERETVKNFAVLETFVLNLKMMGYKFAIDDFGSGFSSFHYIKRFPIDYLKIDGEFIININQDPKDKAFVHSILTLAKELNVKTLAEYVENQEIVDTLKEMGVDYLQGFYIGKPDKDFYNI